MFFNVLYWTASDGCCAADAVDLRWWRCTSSCRRRGFYLDVVNDRRQRVLGVERWRRWATRYPAVDAAVVAATFPPADVDRRRCGRSLPLDAPAAAAGLQRAGWQRGGLCSDGQSRVSQQLEQLWRHPSQRSVIVITVLSTVVIPTIARYVHSVSFWQMLKRVSGQWCKRVTFICAFRVTCNCLKHVTRSTQPLLDGFIASERILMVFLVSLAACLFVL